MNHWVRVIQKKQRQIELINRKTCILFSVKMYFFRGTPSKLTLAHLEKSEWKPLDTQSQEVQATSRSNLNAKYMKELHDKMEKEKQEVLDELNSQKLSNKQYLDEIKKLKDELGILYRFIYSQGKIDFKANYWERWEVLQASNVIQWKRDRIHSKYWRLSIKLWETVRWQVKSNCISPKINYPRPHRNFKWKSSKEIW